MAAGVVADANGEVVAVDEGHIVVVLAIGRRKSPFSESSRRDTGASMGVTVKTAVAAAIYARVGSGISAEVAGTTTLLLRLSAHKPYT